MQVKKKKILLRKYLNFILSFISRYVLVTFPQTPVRYNTPTYVERLLLPERFPTLFQNIVHSYERNRNTK